MRIKDVMMPNVICIDVDEPVLKASHLLSPEVANCDRDPGQDRANVCSRDGQVA
jgi:hypothetical protein